MAPVRVDVGTRFSFPLRDGFDYITDLGNWPQYWPGLLHLDPESRWSQSGDVARLTLKLLGRPAELEMTLTRIVPYSLVEYTSVQRGLPDAVHERHFAEDPGGFAYRIVVGLQPRAGVRGLVDRLVVARGVERTARQTLDNLQQQFATRTDAPPRSP